MRHGTIPSDLDLPAAVRHPGRLCSFPVRARHQGYRTSRPKPGHADGRSAAYRDLDAKSCTDSNANLNPYRDNSGNRPDSDAPHGGTPGLHTGRDTSGIFHANAGSANSTPLTLFHRFSDPASAADRHSGAYFPADRLPDNGTHSLSQSPAYPHLDPHAGAGHRNPGYEREDRLCFKPAWQL